LANRLETPVEEAMEPASMAKRLPTRRILVAGGGALAASIAGGALLLDQPRTIDSSVGEIRRLTLMDGSTLTLDTETRVKIARGSGDRSLELVHGKLFLTIAAASRPLKLTVGRLAMRMAQGAFGLELLGQGPLTAFVTEGRLAVAQSGGFWGRSRAITLAANSAFSLPVGADLGTAAIQSLDPAALDKLLAWRDGMLSFGDETLAAAVREFDRYGPMRIVISDPQLAQQKITGLFKADDPKGFATAVATSFGADVASDGDVLRIFIKK
jgi:transmembrane sensor